VFLDPSEESPAGHVGELRVGAYDDPVALEELARRCTAVTYEFESVPVTSARFLAERVEVFPPPNALEVAQDRFKEKSFFEGLGIPTAAFVAVDTRADLDAAIAKIGLPAILKTRRFGYDGKGQARLHAPSDADAAWAECKGAPSILEAFVPFTSELSILTVRSKTGETKTYPLVENQHKGGILRLSRVPAHVDAALQETAVKYAELVTKKLDYVGVLAIELFEVQGKLLANEMAPRVHNSGHWTIEGAETSQFENHLRAGLGLPLGSTALVGTSAMVNVIGTIPEEAAILRIEGAHLHMYGKEPAPGRKLGHVTVRAETGEARDASVARVQAIVDGAP